MFALALAIKAKSGHPTYMEIECIIDRGDPLIEKLASIAGVKRESVRFLRGKGPKQVGEVWLSNPIELVFAVDTAPSGKRPTNRNEWDVFRKLWVGCNLYQPDKLYQLDNLAVYLFKGLCQHGYEVILGKLRQLWQDDFERMQGMHDYFRFVDEWCNSLKKRRTNAAHHVSDELFIDLLIRYPAFELISQSERWHREIGMATVQESDSTFDEIDPDNWPALLPQPLQTGCLEVISLTSSRQLWAEGTYLEHCVSGYANLCLPGYRHILSIRNIEGESLSTAEISLKDGKDGHLFPVVIQHRARSNTPPSDDSLDALKLTIRHLQEPAMQKHMHELQAFHHNRQDMVDAYLYSCDSRYSTEVMSQVMEKVLKDYGKVVNWIQQRFEMTIAPPAEENAPGTTVSSQGEIR